MSEEGVMAAAASTRPRVDRAWAIEKLLGSGRYPVGVTDLVNDAQALVDFVQEGRAPGKFGAFPSSLPPIDETTRAVPRVVTNPMINRAKAVLDVELTSNVRVDVIRRALEAALQTTSEPSA